LNTGRRNSTVPERDFQNWIAALEKRHLAHLTFSEVSRALRALSSTYVERRNKLAEGAALSGAGKRAAFALFYGPLHFLLVRHIANQLIGTRPPLVLDLGCGTGAAGAAISASQVIGIDKSSWAVAEAARTYREFGLEGRTRQGDAVRYSMPRQPAFVVAAFTMNELPAALRETLLTQLLSYVEADGTGLLIVEPLAKAVAPWWEAWRTRVESAGGRSDEWRFSADLPEIVAKLDRATRLDHRVISGRSLSIVRGPISAASAAASS
jgi:SAM-dependent methyltransferase